MNDVEPNLREPASGADDDRADRWDGDVAPVPRPRPGYQTPSLSQTMSRWAPVAAGVIRAVAGVLAFAASLLTLPIHPATPFLTGVGMLMLVGGCVSVLKETKEIPALRTFARVFLLACCAGVVAILVVVFVWGAGLFAPNLGPPAPSPAARDDGSVRFEAN